MRHANITRGVHACICAYVRACVLADPLDISLDRTYLVQSQATFGI